MRNSHECRVSRDSDEEHLEPKFELPIPPGPNLVTARGLAKIQAKVVDLEALLPSLSEETEINVCAARVALLAGAAGNGATRGRA